MFSEEVLEKIFADSEVQKCPIGTQSTIVHAIERLFEKWGIDVNVPNESVSEFPKSEYTDLW